MFLVGQKYGFVENVNIVIFSHTINVINVKLCMMVLFSKPYLFIPLSVTLTMFQANSNIRHLFNLSLCIFDSHEKYVYVKISVRRAGRQVFLV